MKPTEHFRRLKQLAADAILCDVREMRSALKESRNLADFVNAEYQSRQAKNTQYSLRAFARDLDISASHLSDILSGKNGISRESLERFSAELKLSQKEIELVWALTTLQFGRNEHARAAAAKRLEHFHNYQNVRTLSQQEFASIAHWRHLALLELTRLKEFNWNPSEIAPLLKSSPGEIVEAIERLQNLGLIETREGRLISTDNVETGNTNSSESIRAYHTDLIKLALNAVTTQEMTMRFLSSNISAVRAQDYPRAVESIRTFVEKFNAEFGTSDEADQVYSLNIQYFKVF